MSHITIRTNTLFFAVITTLLMAFTLSNSAHAQDTTPSNAVVSSVSGYATITDSNGEVRRLKEGDTVDEGDKISTGNDSSLQLILSNGKVFTLGALENFTFSQAAASNLASSGSGSAPANLSGKNSKSLSRSSSSLSAAVSAGGSPVE